MEPQKAMEEQPLFESTRGVTTITFVCLAAGGYRILSNGTEVGRWESARLSACMRAYMDLLDAPAPAGRMPTKARRRTARQGANPRHSRGIAWTERGRKAAAAAGL
jgi:hypothetical protein